MTTVATVRSELSDLYVRESAAIEREFSATGEGRTAVARRTALVDTIVQRLWNEIIVSSNYAEPDSPKNFALVATAASGAAGFSPTPTLISSFCTRLVIPRVNSKIPSGAFRRSCGTCV